MTTIKKHTLNHKHLLCLITLIGIILIACLFCGCNAIQAKENPKNTEAHNSLQAVIDQYQTAIEESKGSTDSYFWHHLSASQKYKYIDIGDGETPIKYAFIDLDNDDIDELVISCDKFLINIYKYINNQPTLVLCSWSKSRTTIRENNKLFNYSVGGYNTGTVTLGELNVTSTEKPSDINNIKEIEKLDWLSWKNDGAQIRITKNGEEKVSATPNFDGVQKLIDDIESRYPEKSDINWQFFST